MINRVNFHGGVGVGWVCVCVWGGGGGGGQMNSADIHIPGLTVSSKKLQMIEQLFPHALGEECHIVEHRQLICANSLQLSWSLENPDRTELI